MSGESFTVHSEEEEFSIRAFRQNGGKRDTFWSFKPAAGGGGIFYKGIPTKWRETRHFLEFQARCGWGKRILHGQMAESACFFRGQVGIVS